MNKLWIIIKYEYLRTVKRPFFWISIFLLPVFLAVVLIVSTISSQEAEKNFSNFSQSIKEIDVIDETGILNTQLITPPLKLVKGDKQTYITAVKNQQIDGLIYYPLSVETDGKYEIYAKYTGLTGGSSFTSQAQSILLQSAKARIKDVGIVNIINSNLQATTKFYAVGGIEKSIGIQDLILPGISLTVFFLIVFMSAQYLLQSVVEEKENRMIETILSMIDSKTLISGKIISLTLVAFTQLLFWAILSAVIFLLLSGYTHQTIPFNLLGNFSVVSIIINIYFTVMGYLLFAGIMVGVGSLGVNYKDSQSLTSMFTFISIFPLYFISVLISDPNGLIAKFTSFFPLTAPMVLLIRNSLGSLSPLELIVGIVLIFIYVLISFWLAAKLFNLGALMYDRRPTLKEIIKVMRSK